MPPIQKMRQNKALIERVADGVSDDGLIFLFMFNPLQTPIAPTHQII
jgi:hypothetical protein